MAGVVEDEDDDLYRGKNLGSRLKEPLSFRQLNSETGFTFELDTGVEAELEKLDFLDLESDEEDTGNGKQAKNQNLLGEFNTDEEFGDFEETVTRMTDVTPDGKIKKLVIREAESKILIPNDAKIKYDFIAYAENKAHPIDSTVDSRYGRVGARILRLSNADCIPGLYYGIQSMTLGEISKFWFHYDVAFGALGAPPRIPKVSNILCIVEILSVQLKSSVENILEMTIDERRELPFEAIMRCCKNLQLEGNKVYKEEEFQQAVKIYRKAANILDDYTVIQVSDEILKSDLLGTLCCNLAQAHIKTKDFRKACTAAKLGLRLRDHPLTHKLFYRYAQANVHMGNYAEASSLFRKAMANLRPKDKGIMKTYYAELQETKKYEKYEKEERKEFYKHAVQDRNDSTGSSEKSEDSEKTELCNGKKM